MNYTVEKIQDIAKKCNAAVLTIEEAKEVLRRLEDEDRDSSVVWHIVEVTQESQK